MAFLPQLKSLLLLRGTPLPKLAEMVGMARPNLSTTLGGKHDTRGSTLDALAAALNAEWVLVPKEHLLVVRRLLEGKDAGPDRDAKSSVELFLGRDK